MIIEGVYLEDGNNSITRVKNWSYFYSERASKESEYSYVFVIDEEGRKHFVTACKHYQLGNVFRNLEKQITDQISKGIREDEVVIRSPSKKSN